MALSDLFKDLDPTLASALSEATDALRDEFDRKLGATRAELGLEPAAAESEPTKDLEPKDLKMVEPEATEEAPAAFGGDILDPLEELKHAVSTVDRASSQGEVLEALISGCSRFSSRCAVFLLRDEQVSGWTSFGFPIAEEVLRTVHFEAEAGSPWQRLAADEGTLPLSAEACAPICDKLEGAAPQLGLLIPFVLGNQTAAAIYCDRVAGDAAPAISALQLLSFVASQVLENLPVRDRESTSTLRIAATAETAVGGDEPPVSEPATPEAPVVETEAPEVTAEDLESTSPEAPVAETEAPEVTAEDLEPTTPAAPEAETEAPEVTAEDFEPTSGVEIEESVELEAEEPPAELGTVVTEAPAIADDLFEPEPEPEPEREPEVGPEPAPEPMGVTESESVPPAPSFEQATDEPPAIPSGTSTQVAPPEDLQGPGWAFSGGRSPSVDSADEAQHEEARRLARLLVTEVKLYNEELVEQGRQNSNVYAVLKEDIDRSRQIFDDRIDEDVRSQNDYFREALVRILAGGDPSLLGL